MTGRKQMHLGLIGDAGPNGWRHPSSDPAAITTASYYAAQAQAAERGLFDLYFLADSSGLRSEPRDLWSRSPYFHNVLEPLTALSAVAMVTTHIGLAATATTSYYQPYHVARFFSSLDHISGGRAAWNAVTSANAFISLNFGFDELPSHTDRYARAREFLKVVDAFWDTWDEDAFIYDKAGGVYYDPDKLHLVQYEGDLLRVPGGGLNIARAPQGKPVVIEAGGSEEGRQLAAESAEVIFSAAKTIEEGIWYGQDVRARMVDLGRNPDYMKILPGMQVVVAESELEAQERYEELQALVDDEVAALRMATDLEADISGLSFDEPIPQNRIPTSAKFHARFFEQIVTKIHEDSPTLRELARWYMKSRGHYGTATQIADIMEEWFLSGASDGFIMRFDLLPSGVDDFVRLVIPELQHRGLYRTEYRGKTLRDHLGLPVPQSQFAPLSS